MVHAINRSILTLLLTTLILAPAALTAIIPTPNPKDPCGPAVQPPGDPTIPNSTCTANITLSPTYSTYSATLLNDSTPTLIKYQNCYPSVLDACTALTTSSTPLGVWNWTTPGSQCVMGFFLPPYEGSAKIPSLRHCAEDIFGAMARLGRRRGDGFNIMVVNVRKLPDEEQTGEAVNVGYPSYTISGLPLVHGYGFLDLGA